MKEQNYLESSSQFHATAGEAGDENLSVSPTFAGVKSVRERLVRTKGELSPFHPQLSTQSTQSYEENENNIFSFDLSSE